MINSAATISATTTASQVIKRVLKGNHYNSGTGSHSYAEWTTGRDYYVETQDGQEFFLEYRKYTGHSCGRYTKINPTEVSDWDETNWEKIPEIIQNHIYHQLFPEGTSDEQRIFIFGEAQGKVLNEDYDWAEKNMIISVEETLKIMREIGRWTDRAQSSKKGQNSKYIQNFYINLWVGDKGFEILHDTSYNYGGDWPDRGLHLKREITREQVEAEEKALNSAKKDYARQCGKLRSEERRVGKECRL